MSEVENTSPATAEHKERRIVGRVASNKGDKTITVVVERTVKHPIYNKILRRSTKLYAHDEANQCKEGDLVAIVETRPLSRTKRCWSGVKQSNGEAEKLKALGIRHCQGNALIHRLTPCWMRAAASQAWSNH